MFHCLPESAWADGSLAEAAVQLGKMVGHRNQSQPNPGLNSLGAPCSSAPHSSSAGATAFYYRSHLAHEPRTN